MFPYLQGMKNAVAYSGGVDFVYRQAVIHVNYLY